MTTAHDVASDPDLYNRSIRIGKLDFDCYGYTPSMRTIKFATLVPVAGMKVQVVVRYLRPDATIKFSKGENHMDKDKRDFTFDITLEGATLKQADDFLSAMIAVATAMGLVFGGGAFDVTDDDPDAGGE